MPELLTLTKTRPGGRLQIGTVGGFMSEWWAASNRNARADCVGIYNGGGGHLPGRQELPDQRGDDRKALRCSHQEHARRFRHQCHAVESGQDG